MGEILTEARLVREDVVRLERDVLLVEPRTLVNGRE